MQLPPLETAFMFSNVFLMVLLARKLVDADDEKEKIEKYLQRVSDISSSVFYQLSFLGLMYIEGPLMLVLIMAGFDKMDVYHIALLGFFIVYMLYNDRLKNFALALLLYADFFVLEKYIYSLCMKTSENPNWTTILGISTSYDPDQTTEYFRYPPRLDQYLLVILSFLLYRRATHIGNDATQIKILEKRSKAIIGTKYPKLHLVAVEINIMWYYSMVWVSFTFFLMIIILQERTIINGMNQLILLSLICIYYSRGLKSLISVWYILITSTSVTLCSEIAFQFML